MKFISLAVLLLCLALPTFGAPKRRPSPTPSPTVVASPRPTTTPPDSTAGFAGFVVLFIFGFIAYIFPSLIAALRKHPSGLAICALNILLGWLCIGWIIALVWSLTAIDESRRYR